MILDLREITLLSTFTQYSTIISEIIDKMTTLSTKKHCKYFDISTFKQSSINFSGVSIKVINLMEELCKFILRLEKAHKKRKNTIYSSTRDKILELNMFLINEICNLKNFFVYKQQDILKFISEGSEIEDEKNCCDLLNKVKFLDSHDSNLTFINNESRIRLQRSEINCNDKYSLCIKLNYKAYNINKLYKHKADVSLDSFLRFINEFISSQLHINKKIRQLNIQKNISDFMNRIFVIFEEITKFKKNYMPRKVINTRKHFFLILKL